MAVQSLGMDMAILVLDLYYDEGFIMQLCSDYG
jgi:hypothetical protein